jgi:hypothetical protein
VSPLFWSDLDLKACTGACFLPIKARAGGVVKSSLFKKKLALFYILTITQAHALKNSMYTLRLFQQQALSLTVLSKTDLRKTKFYSTYRQFISE